MMSHQFTYPKVSPVVLAPTAHLMGAPRPVAMPPVKH